MVAGPGELGPAGVGRHLSQEGGGVGGAVSPHLGRTLQFMLRCMLDYHESRDGLEEVAERHGEAADHQTGVVQEQPVQLDSPVKHSAVQTVETDLLGQRPQDDPGHGVADADVAHQPAPLVYIQQG